MKTRLALIDADSMIYITAWRFRNKNVPNLVKMHLSTFITGILDSVEATHYLGFYGSHEDGAEPNFRFELDPKYKAQRPDTPDFIKKWRPVIHDQMKYKWNFMPIDGMEADDAVAIAAEQFKNDYDSIVVVTSDKDLKQIPNITHYDMGKHLGTEMNQFDADKFFCEQMLKGDPTDNIKGLPNIGPKKAANILAACTNSVQLKWTVIRMYIQYSDDVLSKVQRLNKKSIETQWKTTNADMVESSKYDVNQIKRKMRLFVDQEIHKLVKIELPVSWRDYIKQQYGLLRMLSTAPNGFTLGAITEYTTTVVPTPKVEIKDILGVL